MKRLLLVTFLIPLVISAQQFPADLQTRLNTFYQSHVPMQVHLFTNQPEYAAGDTVYFKIDLLAAQGHRPVGGKSILTISLLNSATQAIVRQQFSIVNGRGFNQLILPKTISAGLYILSVSNQWMGDSNTPLHKTLIRIGSSSFDTVQQTLHARPEGGILVTGLSSRIAVAANPYSKASLLENGVPLSEFSINDLGTASINLKPKQGNRYTLVCGKNSTQLPEVQADGVVINCIKHLQSIRLSLVIPENSQYSGRPLSLVASQQGIIYKAIEIIFKSGTFATVDVELHEIPEGVVQLTLFTPDGIAIAERLWFNKKPSTISATLSMTENRFHTRERVDLQLKVTDDGKPVKSNVAISAFNNELTPFDSTSYADLTSDLYLLNDLGYNDLLRANESFDYLDTWMMLSAWLRFDWTNLTKRKDGAFYSQYLTFSGRAFYPDSNEPLPDSTKVTFLLQKNANIYQAYTDKHGFFTVTMLFDFFGTDEAFYRAEYNQKILTGAKVTIDDQIQFKSVNLENKSASKYTNLFETRNEIHFSYADRNRNQNKFMNMESNTLEDEIFGADLTINLNEYQLFPTMAETLKEIIPYSQHRVIHGKNIVRIYDRERELFRTTDPVYVIDGVMTDDTDYFLSLRPGDLVTIKIIHSAEKLNAFGSIGQGGIFLVETKIPNNSELVSRNNHTVQLKGLNETLVPKIQSLLHESDRNPDLRTNLLWLPNLILDESGNATISFNTSDVPGQYKIIGEGITQDGKPFVFTKDFEVVFERAASDNR